MLYKKFHLFHHQHGPDFSRCRFVACTCFSCPPFFSPPSILHRINFVFRIILFSVDPHQHPGAQDMRFQSLILAFRSLHSYVLTYTSNCIFFNLAKVKQSLPDPLVAACCRGTLSCHPHEEFSHSPPSAPGTWSFVACWILLGLVLSPFSHALVSLCHLF